MIRSFSFLIALTIITGIAHSSNAPVPIPPMPLAGSLGESVVGLEAGIARTSGDHFDFSTDPATKTSYVKIGDHYGTFAEFQYEIGSSRIYIATTVSASVTNSKKAVSFDNGSFVMKRLRTATPGVSVGKMINPKTKVYGNISYDFSQYQVDYDLSAGGPQASIKQKLQGPAIGGGMYYKVSGNIIAGIDYKYVMFREQDIRKVPPLASVPTALKPIDHRIVVRVGYNFSFG